MKDFGTTVAHILPSYALHLGTTLIEEGEDPKALSLRIACVGAEPYTEETRRRIEALFDMKVYNSYGLSEMNGPGVASSAVPERPASLGRCLSTGNH